MGSPMAVIFDLDGLLADTEPSWDASARTVLGRRGRRYDEELKGRCMGRHPLAVAALWVEHYQLADAPAELMAERLALLREIYRTRGVQPMPGAGELVGELAAIGTPLAVASGSPRELVELCLERLALRSAFTAVVGSDEVERGKPAPETFVLAAHRLGRDPGACVVLEDSASGIEAARAAGMVCVAVPSGPTPAGAVRRADLQLTSLVGLDRRRLVELWTTSRPPTARRP